MVRLFLCKIYTAYNTNSSEFWPGWWWYPVIINEIGLVFY